MRREACIITMLCFATLSLFCSDNRHCDVPDQQTSCPDPISPDSLLNSLACALETKNLDAYEHVLHDSFRFYFTSDIAESLGLSPNEPFWGKAADTTSTSNLFSDSTVTTIGMIFTYSVEWSRGACHRSFPEIMADTVWADALCILVRPDIKISIEKQGEDPLILWINGTSLDIMVVQDALGANVWTILAIREWYSNAFACSPVASGVKGTRHTSWSWVKAAFNQPSYRRKIRKVSSDACSQFSFDNTPLNSRVFWNKGLS
jgi:hypothetical protein